MSDPFTDFTTPFNTENTVHVMVLDSMVRRAVSNAMEHPWVAAPIEDLIHHCNLNSEDGVYKLSLMSLRDQGVRFLVLPPEGSSDILDRFEPPPSEIL
jgi:hypothetical protein